MAYEMTDFEKEMEQSLLAMRAELVAKLSKSSADFKALNDSASGGDSVDAASDDLASKKMEALNKMDTGRLNAVDQALVRLHGGGYGICAQCGKKIPQPRLRALPFALLCISCKSKQEHR